MTKRTQVEVEYEMLDRLLKVQKRAGYYVSLTTLANLAMREGIEKVEKRFP